MNAKERIDYLVGYLNDRTVEYDEGRPTISDQEWDTFYFELKDLENHTNYIREDSPTQRVIYKVVNELAKSTHNHKMLSLDKTKDVEEVKTFLGDEEYVAMCKMDGLTCSLTYQNGKLVSAETRGDGFIGEDILHNALVIPSIPKKIPYYDELVVDGEIICSTEDFKNFSDEYKNPRNFAAGSIRLLDAKECGNRKLQFIAWDVIKGLDFIPTLIGKLAVLQEEYYFTCVPYAVGDVEKCITNISKAAKHYHYPIDGVVFKFNNIEYGRAQGETTHHFKNAIAYKFYDETYPTRLKYIDWTMGRTGVLTPVAVFDPIDIDGSTVERASLHNYSVMRELLGSCAYVGEPLQVYKANQIIPQINPVEDEFRYDYGYVISHCGVSANDEIEICPICGGGVAIEVSDAGIKNFVCQNPQCEGKLINRLDHFCGKKGLDIKGLSTATLEKLIDWGWLKSYKDLFYLYEHTDEWVKKPGFGSKSVSKICDAIEASKHCELWRFISALGIPLIGSTYSKKLATLEPAWFQIREDIEGKYNFAEHHEGFGPEMTFALLNFDYTEADWLVDNIMDLYNSLWINPDDKTETKEQKTLDGISVVITGKLTQFKNRAELQGAIEKAGGKVASSVSSKTNYLINNDNTSTSSKNLAAKKLGIPILTEEEFVEKFL